MHISDIQIRDPFVVPEDEVYYLFGSTDKDIWKSRGTGFDGYISRGGLSEFEGPFPVFRPPEDFWSETNFWAPEVHRYNGSWYMFATFKPKEGRRGTAILKSEGGVTGPYNPWSLNASGSSGPVTPAEWECLDGTLYLDAEGRPWMIFCHEWQQVADGEICLLPLTEDLKSAAGKPELLFRASEAPWASPLKPDPARNRLPGNYVTDGPNLYTAKNGALLMLWSSFGPDGAYRIGLAKSESGLVTGPWKQLKDPLYSADGGHGMLFHSVEGKLYLTVHTPNKTPNERPIFIEMIDEDGMVKPGKDIIS
ncbi:glycoside hydrolase family 43 protein [Leadbettera azotonutricia]|uniref:Endo-arabinase n=1 Tax=Leadbettera azotonutricia (strain ATCC BAA-888 / DSM 13862 / ZAS-9) TaxID=545695 RepID=F5YEB7_LEAAZ|nr:glycoside hydrolase family 43 protein [Leadbettera azotonutricia]AEF83292.1 endo-arabinase [Leadbettera azotonutricia ZAS-9]